MSVPIIDRGKRAIVAGRTGNGKSTLACFLLARSPGHWVIINPKHTAAYASLADSVIVNELKESKLEAAIHKHRFVIFNPSGADATVEALDGLIEWLHVKYTDLGVCCDELYTLHRNARAGEGLLGWLTRGRELGQSFLGLTQRPRWISQFLFSESDFVGTLDLSLDQDRKRMFEMTGERNFLKRLDTHRWLWYDVANDSVRKFLPVPLDKV